MSKEITNLSSNVLLLSSTDGAHTGRSGYNIICDYLQAKGLIEVRRNTAKTFIKRFSDALLSRIGLSNWYRTSSAILEYKAIQLLKKEPFEIVHLLWGDKDLGFLDLFRNKKKFKLCCTIHNCETMLDDIFNFPQRLKNIDALILMSETQRYYFESKGVPPEKIHVILHGIDTTHFEPSKHNREEDFTVLTVGSWQRDFKLLRNICLELGRISSIKIKIISSSKFKHLFEDLTNVKFQSGLSDSELLQAYQESSCFLITVKDATANNALLEALACGLPIVSERVGGIPEYVNEHCALLCTPNDVSAIVQSIIKISNSNDLQEKMSQAALVRAKELDWNICAKKTEEIYRGL